MGLIGLRKMKIKACIFGVVFVLWTAFITVPFVWVLLLPRRCLVWHLFVWAKVSMWLLRVLVGIRYRAIGLERVPPGPCLFIVNHQSMWETIIFHIFAWQHDPCYVMKRELFFVPFYGLHAWRFGMIGVRRGEKHGQRSLRHLLRLAPLRLKRGQSIIIFPEGTRVIPGEKKDYGVGAWALYRIASAADMGVPVIPVAHNAGLFWQKGPFRKRSGCILVRFLPPVLPGLSKEGFLGNMAELRRQAERLTAEG